MGIGNQQNVDLTLCCLVMLQKGASAQTFFSYIVERVLPKLNELVASDGEDIKLEMLKLCAEMSPHGLTDENVKSAIEPIYNLLLVSFGHFQEQS